jgi:transcriptional regulator with XRE-family HTH domain
MVCNLSIGRKKINYLIGKYMAQIREIFAKNLKENRRKCGISQEQLAEKAGLSTHYIAILEIARSFPTSEVLERIAAALNVEIYELFLVPESPKEELEKLRRTIIDEVRQAVDDSIQKALYGRGNERP